MLEVKRFLAEDGTMFTQRERCEAYERECAEISEIMRQLPPRPDSLDFSNGHGFVKHDPSNFIVARTRLLAIAKRKIPDHQWINDSIEKGMEVHPSWAGRIIDECCGKNLAQAWFRILCTDKEFREWGQPYYTENPDHAPKIEQLN